MPLRLLLTEILLNIIKRWLDHRAGAAAVKAAVFPPESGRAVQLTGSAAGPAADGSAGIESPALSSGIGQSRVLLWAKCSPSAVVRRGLFACPFVLCVLGKG